MRIKTKASIALPLPVSERERCFFVSISGLTIHPLALAVLPHVGSFAESDVPVAAWLYNQPPNIRRILRASIAATRSVPHPFTLSGSRNIILDGIKRAEDDHFSSKSKSQTVILRFYEAFGGHGHATVKTPLPVESATICDVSESLSFDSAPS